MGSASFTLQHVSEAWSGKTQYISLRGGAPKWPLQLRSRALVRTTPAGCRTSQRPGDLSHYDGTSHSTAACSDPSAGPVGPSQRSEGPSIASQRTPGDLGGPNYNATYSLCLRQAASCQRRWRLCRPIPVFQKSRSLTL